MIRIENVNVGAANRDYVKNYINSPTFKKSKKIMNKARRTGYIPYNIALMEAQKDYKYTFNRIKDVVFQFVQSKLEGLGLYDYSEADGRSYFVLWFGLAEDEKFEINITFTFTNEKVVVFINRVFITNFSGRGIMTGMFKLIDGILKQHNMKYVIELEDHSSSTPDGQTRWKHIFNSIPNVEVTYI